MLKQPVPISFSVKNADNRDRFLLLRDCVENDVRIRKQASNPLPCQSFITNQAVPERHLFQLKNGLGDLSNHLSGRRRFQ
jgi:hypothetical protein